MGWTKPRNAAVLLIKALLLDFHHHQTNTFVENYQTRYYKISNVQYAHVHSNFKIFARSFFILFASVVRTIHRDKDLFEKSFSLVKNIPGILQTCVVRLSRNVFNFNATAAYVKCSVQTSSRNQFCQVSSVYLCFLLLQNGEHLKWLASECRIAALS